ncbi:MAG: hypothetical protein HOM79_08835 [Alphaproteobacteria bacterium]|jgi:hypothetical protein|nr:hypothetical protein [Alphaproteobacteria bacterium]
MIIEETGETPTCPICGADEECGHHLADIDRTFLECLGGVFREKEQEFKDVIEEKFISKIGSGDPSIWSSGDIQELWTGSKDSYDEGENFIDLDGYIFYRIIVDFLLKNGAVEPEGSVVDQSGPGMTSTVSLLYADNPVEICDKSLDDLTKSLESAD